MQESYEFGTKHRKLTWIYGLGNCVLSANFQKKALELVLVPFQVVILLLFNSGAGCSAASNPRLWRLRTGGVCCCARSGFPEAACKGGSLQAAEEELSYTEIKERANLADEDLMRSLHSLSCAKYKILIKEPTGKTISKTDRFKLNLGFTDKARRIKASHSALLTMGEMAPASSAKQACKGVCRPASTKLAVACRCRCRRRTRGRRWWRTWTRTGGTPSMPPLFAP